MTRGHYRVENDYKPLKVASASGLNTPTVGLIHADNAYKPIEEHLFFRPAVVRTNYII